MVLIPKNPKKVPTVGRGYALPHAPSPLVSNTSLNKKNSPPYIYCNTLGAKVEVILSLITHQKPGFSTPKSKNVPTVGGGYPGSHTGVQYNTLQEKQSPLYFNHYVLHWELELRLI